MDKSTTYSSHVTIYFYVEHPNQMFSFIINSSPTLWSNF
jgi:hypothetical protein